MLKGIDIAQRIEFTFSNDTDPKTVVVLRPLSGIEMAELSNFQEDGKVKVNSVYLSKMLLKTIVEIRNYPSEGDSVSSVEAEAIGKFINTLTVQHLGELMGELTKVNNLLGQEAKN